ncbi:unnamed protein product [Ostreobium quekettii]|uniref:Uncharacterized protein n=1 Tax=Ostreobium quekettii TaxID=121088 RepID=A0A8S1ILJ7_9CHLO|nr:unnamed protein product [Ostreobium quekettii]|eukprot:evm.model.scf_57.20 EVM.evm.TU.scf_57.20   scf_57:173007-174779(+)
MAREFLALGDRVVICGRDASRLEAALTSLRRGLSPEAQLHGALCDVSIATDVASLASFARERLGAVDRWINNAGKVTGRRLLPDLEAGEIEAVVGANVLGSLFGCREALRLMRDQPGGPFHIFNMGFSRWGASFSKSACSHKATKRALTQLTESLAEELATEGVEGVGVHNLSPGMVLTDLLLKDSNPVARRFFNALAEEPQTVAADLVPRIRDVRGTASSIDYLNPALAIGRVVAGAPQIIFGGRFFDSEGDRVHEEGKRYNANGVEVLYDVQSCE